MGRLPRQTISWSRAPSTYSAQALSRQRRPLGAGDFGEAIEVALPAAAAQSVGPVEGGSVMKGMRRFLLAFGVFVLAAPLSAQNSNLDFLSDLPDYAHLRSMLREYLNREAITRLEERGLQIARLSTPEEVAKRQAYIREQMIRDLGGFPARTPLNARVVGTLDRDGYKIEKVIFESQPHFYVTGNLYLPKTGNPPYPGVLFPLGHENGGKSNEDWQQTLGTLA